jgi:nicotinate dehydrogenase subunit B
VSAPESTAAAGLGSLADHPDLDRWVQFLPPDRVVVRTGKVELGQGLRTTLTVLAAEELGLAPEQVEVAEAVTGQAPEEGFTAGSRSTMTSGVGLRQACAQVRGILARRAAARLGLDAAQLRVDGGWVHAPDGRRVDYWTLAADGPLGPASLEPSPLRPPEARRLVGRPARRVDLPAKLTGEVGAFLADLRLPALRYARVLRGPRPGSRPVGPLPERVGDAQVVRCGNLLALVAEREGDAHLAMEALAAEVRFEGGLPWPDTDPADPASMVAGEVARYRVEDGIAAPGPPPPLQHQAADRLLRTRYRRGFLLHGSIGPSAACARFDGQHLEVWTHSQGIGPLRQSLADALGLAPEALTVRHHDGPGCYGHNGADDVALDAALVARALPGRPVLLRWTRAQEHRQEPLGPAMVVEISAGLGPDGRVRSWQEDVWTYPHNARPVPAPGASRLLGALDLDPPLPPAGPVPMLHHEAGGHRNATPAYQLGRHQLVEHLVTSAPALRTSALRSLGAHLNVVAIEGAMDELAALAGADPLTFRLDHLPDPRARAVLEAAVALAGGLEAPGGLDAPGRGLGFARYENTMAYVACVAEVTVDPRDGQVRAQRLWLAADAGEPIDPDGLVNQLEGGAIQATSWTLKEEARVGPDGPLAADWADYPILRFSEVPEVRTVLLGQPDQPPLGAGEAACGPVAAAVVNATAHATGARFRDLPLRPERVLAVLDTLLRSED